MAKKNPKKKPTPAVRKTKKRVVAHLTRIAPALDPKDCTHPMFICDTRVNRITDEEPATKDSPIKAFSADIKIRCASCGQPFEFIGVTAGLSPFVPMASVDFLELRAPIRPSEKPMAQTGKNKLN